MSSLERVRAHRARKKAAGVTAVTVTSETVQTVVEQFTILNDSLKAKLAEVESTGEALALGQRVFADPDLKYLVESIWFQSPSQQDKLRNHVRSYRRSLKT